MIPQSTRLPKRRIEYVLSKGNRLSSELFTIKFLPTEKNNSRFCVIISTKTIPLAVNRNKVRRRIYEIIRLHLPQIKKSTDVILIGKPAISTRNFIQIEKNLIPLLKKFS